MKAGVFFCILGLLFCSDTIVWAQSSISNWIYGKNVWLKFSQQSNLPQLLPNSTMDCPAGTSAYSDEEGNLLFYTDGKNVYDKNHTITPNGVGLITTYAPLVPNQNALIVPMPGNSQKFYIFTIGISTGLYYSIFDLSLNGGLGDITQKNILLNPDARCKIAATLHENGKDIWLVTRLKNADNQYASYLVNESTISNTPIISEVGFSYFNDNSYWRGQLKFSANGKKIADASFTTMYILSLYNFNKATGALIYAGHYYQQTNWPAVGLEFSPDNSKIYIALAKFSSSPSLVSVYQFSANLQPGTYLSTSKKIISDFWATAPLTSGYGSMLLAENCKIYINKLQDGMILGGRTFDIIHNPNEEGTACGYEVDGLVLPDSVKVFWGVPQYLSNYADPCRRMRPGLGVTELGGHVCAGGVKYVAYAGDMPNYIWLNSAGDTLGLQDTFVVQNAGTYYVHAKTDCGCLQKDTIVVGEPVLPNVDVGEVQAFCAGTGGVVLLAQAENTLHYHWLPTTGLSASNVLQPTANPTQTTTYTLTVTDINGCTNSDSVQVMVHNFDFSLEKDIYTVCAGESVRIGEAPVSGYTYNWLPTNGLDDATLSGPTANPTATTTYTLSVTAPNGCIAKDTVTVVRVELSAAILGGLPNKIRYCAQDTVLNFNVGALDGATYFWNGVAGTQTYSMIPTAGQAQLIVQVVSPEGCAITDSVLIQQNSLPNLQVPNDTTVCAAFLAQVVCENCVQLVWDDGFIGDSRKLESPGVYGVRGLSASGCVVEKSFTLTFTNTQIQATLLQTNPPLAEATTNAGSCSWILQNNCLEMIAEQAGCSFSYPVNLAVGNYCLVVKAVGSCVASDTLRFAVMPEPEPPHLRPIPNVLTPNGDGMNEGLRIDIPAGSSAFKLSIFDRWGMQVFVSENHEATWFPPQDILPGVYFYVYQYKTPDGTTVYKEDYVVIVK